MNAGCSNVTSADRNVIAENYENCRAINSKVQKLEFYVKDGEVYKPAPWVKEWFDAETRTWNAMNAWANNEKVTK